MSIDHLLARARARRTWRTAPRDVPRLIRARAGLTQQEMAEILDVDRSAVSRWEAGNRTPRADVLARYLALLDRMEAGDAH